MTHAQQNHFRSQLKEMSQQLIANANGIRNEIHPLGGSASGGISDLPIHLGDFGAEEDETNVALKLLDHEQSLLAEIKASLQRIEDGTFGTCLECRKSISQARLKAIPYTRYCLACSRKAEADQSKFVVNPHQDKSASAMPYETGVV